MTKNAILAVHHSDPVIVLSRNDFALPSNAPLRAQSVRKGPQNASLGHRPTRRRIACRGPGVVLSLRLEPHVAGSPHIAFGRHLPVLVGPAARYVVAAT
ncbi:MAG TPA: hypothetical protein VHV74_16230 [Pseudonocardiaceae bacterium]|jgi:hypothetical protein|nr:hypothetical protein [Pseudonocardiaceae bacterium]